MYKIDNNINIQDWYVFGDSVSKGIIYNDKNGRYEISKINFVDILAKEFNINVKNFSLFGATVNKGLHIYERNEKNIKKPGIAVLEFGGNDCDFFWEEISQAPERNHDPKTKPDDFLKLYKKLIDKLKSKNLLTVILNLPPLEPNRYFKKISESLNADNILTFLGGSPKRIYQWHESYNSVLPALATQTGSIHIDLRQGMLEKLNPGKYMCADGIHPNALGHELIAEIISEKIKKNISNFKTTFRS